VDTRFAAPMSRRIGATSRLAKAKPIHTADNSTVSAITDVHQRKGCLHADTSHFGVGYSSMLSRFAGSAQHARHQ